jgi:c(7)-type cytochrome triheme protein
VRRSAPWRRWLLLAALLASAPISAVSSPETVRLPPVVPRASPPPALFSHWRHQGQQCYRCHPSLFPQEPLGFTHQQMQRGEYCGACHDGEVARAVSAFRCEVCHAVR